MRWQDVVIATIRFDRGVEYSHFRVTVETRACFETGELSSIHSYSGPEVEFSGQTDSKTDHWYAVRVESKIQSDFWDRLEASYKLIKKWRAETINDSDIAVQFFKLCKIAKVKNVLIVGFNGGKAMSVEEAIAIFARKTAAMVGVKND